MHRFITLHQPFSSNMVNIIWVPCIYKMVYILHLKSRILWRNLSNLDFELGNVQNIVPDKLTDAPFLLNFLHPFCPVNALLASPIYLFLSLFWNMFALFALWAMGMFNNKKWSLTSWPTQPFWPIFSPIFALLFIASFYCTLLLHHFIVPFYSILLLHPFIAPFYCTLLS